VLGRIGVWLAAAAGLVVLAGLILFVFEGISHWPANPAQKSVAIAEAEFRRCPAVVAAPPRPAGAPVDDVGGVRPGLSRQDSENIFRCMHPDFAFFQELQPYEATGKARQVFDQFRVARNGEAWRLALFGPQDGQAVAIVRREATFSPGRAPVLADTEVELIRHFGPAHVATDLPAMGGRLLTWTYLRDGRPVRKAPVEGSPTYLLDMAAFMAAGFTQSACAEHAKIEPESAPTFDIRCGLTIRAVIDAASHDRAKAWRVRLVVVDQQALARAFGAGG
jgi:hypothetical protein